MLFSQRKGLKPVKSAIQIDSMDKDLRNSLWNLLTVYIWDTMQGSLTSEDHTINTLCKLLWIRYFKEPIDTIPVIWRQTHGVIKGYFFNCKWNEVYDLMETIIEIKGGSLSTDLLEKHCNAVLEKELSGYRLIKGKFTQITSEEEVAAIEEALSKSIPLKPVYTHLKTALDLLSDRKNPNYRNSIKESISAVEAICRLITANPKTTLGQALKVIKNKVGLHSALEKAFENMYGYTSDENGIRHSLLGEPTLKFIDAKFMLVSCSAFINYLIDKTSGTGINL